MTHALNIVLVILDEIPPAYAQGLRQLAVPPAILGESFSYALDRISGTEVLEPIRHVVTDLTHRKEMG
jgi:hypothetical protein